MKSLILYSLFIVLTFTSISFAQEFQLGLQVEGSHLSTSKEKLPDPAYSISTAHVLGTVLFNHNIGIDLRLGYDWSDFYKGGDIGVFSKYYYKDFYALGGIVYHHITKNNFINEGKTPASDFYFLREQDLFMPAIGIGFNPGRHFSVELMVQHGLGKKVGEHFDWLILMSSSHYPPTAGIEDINVKWITKLGISYAISF